jgi:hypothetical protein
LYKEAHGDPHTVVAARAGAAVVAVQLAMTAASPAAASLLLSFTMLSWWREGRLPAAKIPLVILMDRQ